MVEKRVLETIVLREGGKGVAFSMITERQGYDLKFTAEKFGPNGKRDC